jgi:hypothetical protein
MSRDKMFDRMHNYNLDKIESIITVAIIAESDIIYIPKKIRKLALQMLKDKKLADKIKIKTI